MLGMAQAPIAVSELMIEIYHPRLMAGTNVDHSYHRGVIVYKKCLVRCVCYHVTVCTFVRIHLYVFIWRINFYSH